MMYAAPIPSFLTAAAGATPLLLLSARQVNSLATIRIFSDPDKQHLLQTIEAQDRSSVTELGPPAVMACAGSQSRDGGGCRYLAWFDLNPNDPSTGVDPTAADITPEGDFPPGQDVEVCMHHVMDVNNVKQQIPLRRVEVVCA